MKITNIRYGFATNSSASHSIILITDKSYLYDNNFEISIIRNDNQKQIISYGNFLIENEKYKRYYLFISVYLSLKDVNLESKKYGNILVEENTAKNIAKFISGYDGDTENLKDVYCLNYYDFIEFLSNNVFKTIIEDLLKKGKKLPFSFKDFIFATEKTRKLKEFFNFIAKADFISFAGKDEDLFSNKYEKIMNKYGFYFSELAEFFNYYEQYVIREDKEKKALVIFNRSNGTKIRFSEDGIYEKASWPELVDIKITDYCPFNCSFCYQASTKKGRHASLETIEKYADILAEMGVFEVAIGGGEPTLHPNFIKILEIFSSRGIVPNFTTYSKEWLKCNNKENYDKIFDLVGNIGVSVHNRKDLKKYQIIHDHFKNHCNRKYKIFRVPIVQHVVGTLDPIETMKLIAECYKNEWPILLLGYKNVGFGKDYDISKNMEDYEFMFSMMFSEIFNIKEKPRLFPYTNTLRNISESNIIPDNDHYTSKKEFMEIVKMDINEAKHYLNLKKQGKVEIPEKEKAVMFSVSIDTAFANHFSSLLSKLAIPSFLYDTKEGKFSMYIDAVENLIAPSSYIEKNEMIPVTEISREFIENEWRKM